MPYIGNVLTSFAVETGNINDQAVTAPKLSATGGTDGQVLALDSNLNLEWVSDPAGQWVTSGSNLYYNDGNVGIGSTSPSSKLVVSDAGNNGIEFIPEIATDQNLILSYDRSGSARSKLEIDSSELLFTNANSERMRIDSSGNVGIGTSSPASILHTSGSSDQTVTIQTTTAGADSRINFRNSGGTDAGGIFYKHNGNSLLFLGGGSNTERMRIDSSGRLLVATTSSTANSSADDLQIGARTDSGERGITVASSAAGSIRFADDGNDTAGYIFYSHSDNSLRLGADGSERVRIDSSGNVGIGTTSPNQLLHIQSSGTTRIQITGGSSDTARINLGDADDEDIGQIIYNNSNNSLQFIANGSERMRVTSSGKLVVGHSSATDVAAIQSQLQVVGADAATGSISIRRDQNVASGPLLVFGKSRSGSRGGNTAVQANDIIGAVLFNGADGTDLTTSAARIKAEVDGTPGSNDMPGRLVFETTADGASSLTERMRITSDGITQIQKGTDNGHILTVTGGTTSRGLTIDTAAVTVGATTANDSEVIFDAQASISGTTFGGFSFRTGGGERLRIQRLGGISFNGDTAAANALDDYEEGTWTAALDCANNKTGSVTYSTQTGDYVKIGRLCFITINLGVSSSTLGGGNLLLTGLPFAARSENGRRGGFLISYTTIWSGISGAGQITLRTETNQTQCRFNYHSGNLNTTNEPGGGSISSSGGALFISGCYEVE